MSMPSFLLAALLTCTLSAGWGAVSVTTQHFDIERSGANTSETSLTPTNVATATFGKLFTLNLAANVNGQALYMPGLTINGAVHNVVIVYMSNNVNYIPTPLPPQLSPCGIAAYDADAGGAALWSTTLTPAAEFTTNTPVIDATTNLMYFVSKDNNDSGENWLHAVNILTGAESAGSPIVIAGSVAGTGGGSSGGTVTFPASHANCRPGLLLLNGVVYCGFSFNTDAQPYHGWIFGYTYNGTAFTQRSIFCDTPNSEAGGIWQAGKGLASDGTNIYCTTGNGNFDNSLTAGSAFSMCVLRLSPTLSVLDYFAPSNESSESNGDADLGNAGLTIIPGSASGGATLGFVGSTKYNQGHLVNINNLGHFNGATNTNAADACLQTVSVNGAVGSNPVSWNSGTTRYVYLDGSGTLSQWPITGAGTAAQLGTAITSSVGGGNSSLCLSSNGTSNGILWVQGNDGSVHARNATSITTEYWSSTQNSSRDGMPNGPGKFQFPMVANGKVYVADSGAHLVCYGLLSLIPTQLAFVKQPSSVTTGSAIPTITVAVQGSSNSTVTTSSASVTIAIGTNPGAGTLSGTTTVTAINGIATFNGLSINNAGTGYTLVASSSGLSGATSTAFNVSLETAPPTITPNGGTFSGPVTVTLSDTTAGATIYYTTNGTTPTTASTVYDPSSPPLLSSSATVKAIAAASGLVNSTVTSAAFTISGSTPYGLPTRPQVSGVTLPATNTSPPATLSATGLFTSVNTATNTFTPTPGIVPYNVIMPLWSDGAQKQRWIALPGSSQIGFQATGSTSWAFPGGTIFIKNFAVVTNTTTTPVQTQMVETRVLVLDNAGTNGYGISYQWLPANTTNASLAPSAGVSENISVTTAAGTSTQVWTIPSQANCLVCHNANAGFVLGVKTGQLNGSFTYPSTGVADNQLRTWNYLQMFTADIGEANITSFEQFVSDTSTTAPLQSMVKCYLDANCAQCHRPGGANTAWDARYDTPIANQGIINGAVATNLGIPGALVVVPQEVPLSILDVRMRSTNAANQMPPLARSVVDITGSTVIEEWINSLPPNGPSIASLSPTSGPVATIVTITGTNLSGATGVSYNGAATTFNVLSATTILAAVSAGAASGTFAVTVVGGSATSPAFTVTATAAAPTISALTPSSGTVASLVTISGTGLSGTTAVKFNGTAAVTVTMVNDTTIIATVPAGATTGTVSVTTPAGNANSPAAFTVNGGAAPAVPTITAFAPASGGVGTQVTLTGTNLSGATVVQFNGISAQFSVVSATQITAVAPGGVASGPLAVTTPGGTAVSATGFTVVATPTISSYTVSSGTGGTTVTITGTNLGGATGVYIGGVIATFTVTSTTSISASIPSSGGSATPVTVTTPGGVATSANSTAPAAGSSSSGGRCGSGIFSIFGLLLLVFAWRRRLVAR